MVQLPRPPGAPGHRRPRLSSRPLKIDSLADQNRGGRTWEPSAFDLSTGWAPRLSEGGSLQAGPSDRPPSRPRPDR